MKRGFKITIISFAIAGILASQNGWADQTSSTSDLEQRLDNLESQVADLKQQLQDQKQQEAQNAQQAAQAPGVIASAPAYVTANSKDGFAFKSADGDFSLKIGGYTQFLARDFGSSDKEDLQSDHGSNTSYGEDDAFLARRVRLIIQGTVAHDFDYYLQPELGYNNALSSITSTSPSAYSPALQDAWIDWKYFPDFTIKAGKFKTPFDLENLQDTRVTDFVELGLTGNLTPQRDIGVQAGGNLYFDWISYAAGIFNGAADHENPYGGSSTAGYENGNATGVGRIFATPFKDTSIKPLQGLGVGYAVSYGKEKGSDIPASYVTTGQAPFFSYNSGVANDGPQLRTEPQAFYYYKSLGILGEKINDYESLEYTANSHIYRDKPDNHAFNVEASYVLTGENASYNGVTPKNNFNPGKGTWGAFEVVGRYGELKLDDSIFSEGFASESTSASEARAWSTGLNWYLNSNAKLVFDYEQTKFDDGAAAGVNGGNRKTENLFLTMLQLSIG